MLYYKLVEMADDMHQEDFTHIDIEEFFDSDETKEKFSTELVVLSQDEAAVLAKLIHFLKDDAPDTLLGIMDRFADALTEYGSVEKPAKLEGRQMLMFIAPLKK